MIHRMPHRLQLIRHSTPLAIHPPLSITCNVSPSPLRSPITAHCASPPQPSKPTGPQASRHCREQAGSRPAPGRQQAGSRPAPGRIHAGRWVGPGRRQGGEGCPPPQAKLIHQQWWGGPSAVGPWAAWPPGHKTSGPQSLGPQGTFNTRHRRTFSCLARVSGVGRVAPCVLLRVIRTRIEASQEHHASAHSGGASGISHEDTMRTSHIHGSHKSPTGRPQSCRERQLRPRGT